MTDHPATPGFSTLAIHAGTPPGAVPALGITPFLVEQALGGSSLGSTSLDGASLGGTPLAAADPTGAMLEERIATLEGGTAAVAVATGHAAVLTAFHALLQAGDEFVAARRFDRGAADRFETAFKGFGWHVKWAQADRPESFVEALSDRTKAIFIDSIAEPGGQVTDIETIASVARRARVPLVVDNTLATPYLVRPLEHGADILTYSAVNVLAGSGTATGGLVIDGGTFEWIGDERFPALSAPRPGFDGLVIGETFGNFAFATACRVLALHGFGPAPAPLDAGLVLSGIETLPLRMQRHCDNALAVARHLARHSAVAWVGYAGLEADPGHGLALRYCPNGSGAAFAFGVRGGYEAAAALVKRLQLFSHLTHVGGTRSLASHPASTTHRRRADDPQADVVRVSIGLEDVGDIIADLDQALAG